MAISLEDLIRVNAYNPHVAARLVEERFAQAEAMVSTYDTQSALALQALADFNFSVPIVDTIAPGDETPPELGPRPDAPVPVADYVSLMEDVTREDITALRTELGLVDVAVETVTLPIFDVDPITIVAPQVPTDQVPTIDGTLPVLDPVNTPLPPSFSLPEIPVLETVALPVAPEIAFGVFEGTLPTADLTPPDPVFLYVEATYQSDVEEKLRYHLVDGIENGGTGLSAEAEQAFWDRALERLNYELEKTYNAVMDLWGAQGFEMPDGILAGQLREVLFESDRRKQDQSRDVMYKQAELAHEYMKFLVTSGLSYEKQMMDQFNQIQQRSFEAAKYTLEATINVFNARVAAYTAQLDVYKTQAQVYETTIRAELAKVEVYKSQLEGAKVLGELQVQQVEIYSKQVDALKVLIDLYNAEMGGAKLALDINRAKIDLFGASIEAQKAQISAVTAKFDLYTAQWTGEKTRAEVYATQVEAYTQRIQSKKIEADINIAEAQVQLETNKNAIEILRGAIDQFKADVEYQSAREDAGVKAYGAEIDAYKADVDYQKAYLGALIDDYKTRVAETSSQVEWMVKQADSQLRAATAMQEMNLEALKTLSNIMSQKAASALSATSASAQVGYNESDSKGSSYSHGVQYSETYGNSDSRQYSESYGESYSEGRSVSGTVSYNVGATTMYDGGEGNGPGQPSMPL